MTLSSPASLIAFTHSQSKSQQSKLIKVRKVSAASKSVTNNFAAIVDEIKLEVEQTTMKFIDLARQMETFFLQKRFLLSSSKPELLMKEENVDLRNEILRKDELIKKHLQKIGKWKEYLSDVTAIPRPALPQGAVPPPAGMGGNVPPPMMSGPRPHIPLEHPQMMQQQMMPNPNMQFMHRPNIPAQGPMGVGPAMGGNPLAFLEKTTNNIDMGGPAPR